MKITWYAHSCFLVETEDGSAVLDPYAPGSVPGLSLPPLEADLVLCSHEHSDHNFRRGVKRSGKEAKLHIERIESFHDEKQGALRGPNTIHVLEAEGLRVVHLGDLGHMLSLLIPVGGYFTIGPEQAAALAERLQPSITVPMHYRGAGFGYEVIGPVEDFLCRRDKVLRLETNVLRPEELETPVTVVLRCPV